MISPIFGLFLGKIILFSAANIDGSPLDQAISRIGPIILDRISVISWWSKLISGSGSIILIGYLISISRQIIFFRLDIIFGSTNFMLDIIFIRPSNFRIQSNCSRL